MGMKNGNDSHSGNEDSHSGNGHSHHGETKKNTKKNRKKNVTSKKNHAAPVVADAPTGSASPQGRERETDPQPCMGSIWVSETGDLLFEADTGSGSLHSQ